MEYLTACLDSTLMHVRMCTAPLCTPEINRCSRRCCFSACSLRAWQIGGLKSMMSKARSLFSRSPKVHTRIAHHGDSAPLWILACLSYGAGLGSDRSPIPRQLWALLFSSMGRLVRTG